jgi:hypothetical protein
MAHAVARDRSRWSPGSGRQRPPDRGSRRNARLARQPGELRDPRLDGAPSRTVAAHLRLHRHRPGGNHDLGGDPGARAALPDRARAPRGARLPEDDRQARHPGLDPDPSEVQLRGDERLGRARLARGRLDGPGPRLLGMGKGRAQGPRPARLHAERLDQDLGRSIFRPPRVSAPITWDELDDPDLRPNRWTIRTIVERVAERGDLFAAAQTDSQELPKV